MGSTLRVKWIFYALFGTTSIAKLFHSFEYRKIPGYNSLWRCPLYSSTIFKSWIQLLTVSIFALPNKSPSLAFWLSHFANENLLNVYVLHFLDKQWLLEFLLPIIVLNDQEKKFCFSENFHMQTKNIHNFLEDSTRFTPGIEAWSRATKKMGFHMDTKEKLIPKGKVYDPTLNPGPNVSWYKSTKKICRGRKPIKIHSQIVVWSYLNVLCCGTE